jgi:hypothetical protein
LGQDSTIPATPHPLKKHLQWTAPRQWRGPMSIIMRATLHDHALTTY